MRSRKNFYYTVRTVERNLDWTIKRFRTGVLKLAPTGKITKGDNIIA